MTLDRLEEVYVTLPEDVVEGLCTLFCSAIVPNPPNASSYKTQKPKFTNERKLHYITLQCAIQGRSDG